MAGLAELILGQQNPFAQFVNQHHNVLTGVGAGLARGPTFQQGLSYGAQNIPQASQADDAYATAQKAEQERQAQIQQQAALRQKYAQFFQQQNQPVYSQFVADGVMDPGTAYADWQKSTQKNIDPSSTVSGRAALAQQYNLTGDVARDYVLTGKLPGSNQSTRAFGSTVYFQNTKDPSQIRAVQPMTEGAGQDMLTGGNLPGDPADWQVVDPITMAQQKAQKVADEKNAAVARAALPAAEQSYAVTQQALHQLKADASVMAGQAENFSNFGGVIPQQYLPVLNKTNRANFMNVVDQLSGDAFLNIRQALKGAGQVTDFEGQKGEDAISRMRKAVERGDNDAFNKAVTDFQAAIDNGLRLLREQAQGNYSAGSPNVTGGGDVDAIVNQILGQ